MLKLLDEDSIELRILEFLNNIKSDANHVIPVLDTFRLDVGTVIALPIASRLDCRAFTTPPVALDLMYQLIDAVAFIHENRVAHLDLKPDNILVSCTDDRPRLVVIDFGISVFVDSPDTQIKGFAGTPGWVAPEIGTEHGPRQTYSPIRADLWACGQLLFYMAPPSLGQLRIIQLARDLSSGDPLQRPLIHAGTTVHLIEATKDSLSTIA
jgi:serine/threonine protein kinase